jgi:hypothetical protein
MEMLEYRETSAGQCKSSFKVVVPVEKSPGFNFIGRLLGPRGNTLKDMQAFMTLDQCSVARLVQIS